MGCDVVSIGHHVNISVVSPLMTVVDVETWAFEVVVMELPLLSVVVTSTIVVVVAASPPVVLDS